MAIERRSNLGARSTRGTELAVRLYALSESDMVNGHAPEACLAYAVHAALCGEAALRPHAWADEQAGVLQAHHPWKSVSPAAPPAAPPPGAHHAGS